MVYMSDPIYIFETAEANVDGLRLSLTGMVESLCDTAPVLALNAQLFTPVASIARPNVRAGKTGRRRTAMSAV